MLGIPRVIVGQTTASADEVLAVTLSPKTINVGNLMAGMLRVFEEPALLLYCAALNRIVATTDEATMDLMLDLWGTDHGAGFVLRPNEGSFGVSRPFQKFAPTGRDEFTGRDWIVFQLGNGVQRRTLGGLVNLADSLCYNDPQHMQRFDVLVSQLTAEVEMIVSDGTLAAALPSLPATGQTITIDLIPKQTRDNQIFE